MPASYIELSNLHVALAAALIVVNGAISVLLRLGMERTLAWAGVRTVVQLLIVGLVLHWVFAQSTWYTVLAMGLLMTAVAGVTAVRRTERRFRGIWLGTLVSVAASSWLVTGYALVAVVPGIEPWYRPQYAIPLLGMVLGNTLNGISLGLNALTESLAGERGRVEGLLSLGATRWEAASESVRKAVRTGMIPIVNAMLVVGIVSLPGMMTGQLLSGTSPEQAVRYQIVIMFLIAAATGLGTVGAVLAGYHQLFSREHQFLSQRIERPK